VSLRLSQSLKQFLQLLVAYPRLEANSSKVLNTFSVARYQEAVNKVLGRVTDNLVRGETSDLESGVFETHQAAPNQVKLNNLYFSY